MPYSWHHGKPALFDSSLADVAHDGAVRTSHGTPHYNCERELVLVLVDPPRAHSDKLRSLVDGNQVVRFDHSVRRGSEERGEKRLIDRRRPDEQRLHGVARELE